MEESYTVHRRRKAAAKRREKTPEPSSRSHLLDASDDEEEARRAKMQQMADDAEKHEQEIIRLKQEEQTKEEMKNSKRNLEESEIIEGRKNSNGEKDVNKRKSQEESSFADSTLQTRESDTVEKAVIVRTPKREVTSKADEDEAKMEAVKGDNGAKEKMKDPFARSKEVDDDSGRLSDGRKVEKRVEKRVKKKSKERVDRYSRSTDSSEDDRERSPRRTKSPESSKHRVRKSSARSKTSGDSDVTKKDVMEKPAREKRLATRQKQEESETLSKPERRHSRRYSQTDETDEAPTMKKSETFPREGSVTRSVSSEIKKQIIPISNESLIEDFAKAQRDYLLREHSIMEPDPFDISEHIEEKPTLRRRKISVPRTEDEQELIKESIDEETKKLEKIKQKSWFSWLSFFCRKTQEQEPIEKAEKKLEVSAEVEKKVGIVQLHEKTTLMDFFRALRDVVAEFRAFVAQNPRETAIIKDLKNRCIAELLLMMIYCGLGAFVFRFTEGAFETFYKCGVKRVKRDFLDSLWNYSHNMREDDWKSMARKKLMEFEEQLHAAHEAGVHSYSGQKSWSFLNAVVYCLTVITTIGYGHIAPSTTTGKAITIIYAIFGIPMFLIILADFGKLFTRGIKFLWAFVRRLYYTGSCRKVRGTAPVQEVMKGVQLVYDLATFRRPSQMNPEDIEEIQRHAQQSQQSQQTVLNLDGNMPDTPGTPAMSNFAIDDEFNLPISVAIVILVGYIFIGATLYYMWEDWGFFESFYFVFISMSTIGFGDYVPQHPIYMMCSIIYLVFGLALTSMCINVVQVVLSDSFKQASQKIGATIGFEIAEEDGSVKPAIPPPVEVADVHTSIKESESGEKIAPRAKQEEVDL